MVPFLSFAVCSDSDMNVLKSMSIERLPRLNENVFLVCSNSLSLGGLDRKEFVDNRHCEYASFPLKQKHKWVAHPFPY